MNVKLRLLLFALAVLCLLPLLAMVAGAMPPFGAHPLPYGDAINQAAPAERHVTNMVTAVNFDYRSFDTLGEEFMLLAAVTGTVVLLRGARGEEISEKPGTAPGRDIPPRSEAVMLICRVFAPLTILFGLYVVLHAQLTPGGGFQGGVIIGSGLLLLFLGEGYASWRKFMRTHWLDACEGGGAAAYAVAGLGSMAAGGKYLENLLPLGKIHTLLSGGLILILNLGVAFAVAGGFGLLFLEFVEETRAPKDEGK
jgi:multicomponent Na+:H+ antiporter subunit B